MVCNFFFAVTSWSVFQKGGHRGWNEIFDGIGRLLARFCHRPKQRPLFRSILRSFIGLWAKIGHWNKTACSESKPAQRSRSKSTISPKKRMSAKIPFKPLNSTATSDGGAQKAWKRCLAWFWIDCNQSLEPHRLQMKFGVWTQCRDQPCLIELRFWILRFLEQYPTENNHLLCY